MNIPSSFLQIPHDKVCVKNVKRRVVYTHGPVGGVGGTRNAKRAFATCYAIPDLSKEGFECLSISLCAIIVHSRSNDESISKKALRKD